MDLKYVQTICPFCGTGCSVNLAVVDGCVAGTQPYHRSPVNEGRLCRKGGFCEEYIGSDARLVKPLVRKGDKLEETSWDEALKLVADKIKASKPEEVACIATARGSNEDAYAMVKLASEVIKTKNIDNVANLCNPKIGNGIAGSVGFDASTGIIADIPSAKAVFLLGVDLYEQNPILISQVTAARKAGATVIAAGPAKTPTGKLADISVVYNEGTEVALLNAIKKEIVKAGKAVKTAEKCKGYDECKLVFEKSDSAISGVDSASIQAIASALTAAETAVLAYSSSVLSGDAATGVANLALLTGNEQRIIVLRDRNNTQGAIDVGAVAKDGLSATAAIEGGAKTILFMADSPSVCECTCTQPVDAIKARDFVVVWDSLLSPAALAADVVLPVTALAEQDGTQTNTERRIQLLTKAVDAPGEAKPAWETIASLADVLGSKFGWTSAEDVFAEITGKVPSYKGITYEQVRKPEAICWPATVKGTMIAVDYKEA